jgi:hypothetical protein
VAAGWQWISSRFSYHGTVDKAHQDEVCRSKAKEGTTHFFTYATAYAVVRGRRYTLAMCRVRAKQTMDAVLRTLLTRLGTLGIRIKLLVLDRGFYSVRVIQALITGVLPFIPRSRGELRPHDFCLAQQSPIRGDGVPL